MIGRLTLSVASCFLLLLPGMATQILIPMDDTQKDHLKAYGIAYWALQDGQEVDWLLNYGGGSFACPHSTKLENELVVRGVSYVVISDAQYNEVRGRIANPDANMEVMKLD